MSTSHLIPLFAGGLIVGAIYGVIAVCFVLLYRANRAANLGHGEIVLVGTWACWWLVTSLSLPLWAGFIICLIFMLLLCMTMRKMAVRPLVGPPVVSLVVATMVLTLIFQALLKWMLGPSTKPSPSLFTAQSVSVFALDFEISSLVSFVCSIVAVAGLAYFFKVTKSGVAMRAPALDQQIAQRTSAPIRPLLAMSWAIAAMASALSAVVAAGIARVPNAVEPAGMLLLPLVIAGGLESMSAVVLGGVIIGIVESLARFSNSEYLCAENLMSVAPFYALLLILLVKPFDLFVSKGSERG